MADHMDVDIEGVRGAVLRFERFPERAREKLDQRIAILTREQASLDGAARSNDIKARMSGQHSWPRKLADPIRVTEKLHSRISDIAGAGFIAGPAAAMQDQAIAEISAAVAEATAEADGA